MLIHLLKHLFQLQIIKKIAKFVVSFYHMYNYWKVCTLIFDDIYVFQVTVEDLKKTITNRFLEDAKLVYRLLESEQPESLTQEIRQQYLEMLCYFNESEPIYEEWIEERWLQQGQSGRDRLGNTWKYALKYIFK